MSGLRFQPSLNFTGAGASFGLPSGAPLSAHAERVAISFALRRRSLRKWPTLESANHGGIFCVTTAALMAFAQGRESVYVRRDIGAISPGRWQVWQFCCRIGRTSLENVAGAVSAAKAAVTERARAKEKRSVIGTSLPKSTSDTGPGRNRGGPRCQA